MPSRLNVLCAQLTRNLFAIAKFLFHIVHNTLTYRRSRGDMIETYNLLTGKYDQQVALTLPKKECDR